MPRSLDGLTGDHLLLQFGNYNRLDKLAYRTLAKAKRFLAKALRSSRDRKPHIINTDKNPAYGEAIAELKQEGAIPAELEHRQASPNISLLHFDDACR